MGTESQLRRLGGRKPNKSPPIMSHEFIIQNHADIVSCIAMLFVVGLMFQVTAPLAAIFVTVQHNVTSELTADAKETWAYVYGVKDMASMFFYSLICIVVHAVLQEYGFDKLQRKIHMSKTKTAKFSESGQLAVFYLAAAVWGGYVIVLENLLGDVTLLWKDYPSNHAQMSFAVKLFFIGQVAYWLHHYPELYFQKAKRDEVKSRSVYTTLYLLFIVTSYILKWKFWNAAFILVRLGCVTLAVLTFWYGLRLTENPRVDFTTGNFNTAFIRLNCLLAVFALQGWLMWNFICAWLRRSRASAAFALSAQGGKAGKYNLRSHQKKPKARRTEDDVNSLPEADQHEIVRQRSVSVKKE